MADQDHNDKIQIHVVLTRIMLVSHYRIIEKIGAGGISAESVKKYCLIKAGD